MRVAPLIATACLALLGACASAGERRYDDMFPVFSPDGTRIAFTSTRSGDPEIYTARADGSDLRRLTRAPGRDAHPYWMPDGESIVFQSPRNGGDVRIFTMRFNGWSQRELAATNGFCGVPTVSPDSGRIAFMCSASLSDPGSAAAPWRIYLMNADGSNVRAVTEGPGNDQVANWSPDGRRLVFWSDRDGCDHLYTLDLQSGRSTQLTGGPQTDRGALYSPDGRLIYFMSNRQRDASWGLYAMPANGGPARFVAPLASEYGVPYLSPDGRAALLVVPTPQGQRIARYDLGTGMRTMLEFR